MDIGCWWCVPQTLGWLLALSACGWILYEVWPVLILVLLYGPCLPPACHAMYPGRALPSPCSALPRSWPMGPTTLLKRWKLMCSCC